MPALVLILFITAEAFMKNYAPGSFYTISAVLVGLSLAYFFYYFKRNANGKAIWQQCLEPDLPANRNLIFLLLIVAAGCLLRYWRLGSLFEGMTFDEAYKGLDAIAIRKFGERPVFLDWNGGREALIVYIVAFTQSFFDHSSVSVRIVNATAGWISISVLYLLARDLFNHRIGLLSAFLLAFSKWHIIHTRYGVRAGLYLGFEIATLYFLLRVLNSQQKRAGSAIASGVIGGLGFYTYIAYRIFPAVVASLLVEKSIRQRLSKHWMALAVAGVLSIAIIAPVAKFYFDNRASFSDRMKRTQVWSQPGAERQNPVELIADSAIKTLGLFTFEGDSINRHNLDQEPMLSPFLTACFLLGIFLVIIHPSMPYMKFLLLYFFLTLLPGILSVGAPNVPRVFGSLPVAILFVSFGISAMVEMLSRYSRVLSTAFMAIMLGGSALTGILDTMVRQPAMLDSLPPKTAELWGMDRDPENVAKLANQMGNRCEVYVSPQYFFHSTVQYQTYGKSNPKLIMPGTDLRKETPPGKVVVVFLQPYEVNPWWLRDDPGKRLYKWWLQIYGLDLHTIRRILRRSYDPPFTKTSDWRLIEMLEKNYPRAKKLQFEYIRAYVFSVR